MTLLFNQVEFKSSRLLDTIPNSCQDQKIPALLTMRKSELSLQLTCAFIKNCHQNALLPPMDALRSLNPIALVWTFRPRLHIGVVHHHTE